MWSNSLKKTASLTVLGMAIGAANAAMAANTPQLSSPMGITLVDVSNGAEEFLWRRLGDTEGRPLYTYDADARTGKAGCVAECAKEFPPYLASAGAQAFGDWTIIARDDGAKQWAYQGQALYRYSGKDPIPKRGNRQEENATAGQDTTLMDPASKNYSPKDGWRRAALNIKIKTPPDIAMKSLATANGYGFVVPKTGMVMYTLKSAPKNVAQWTPVYAPQLAQNMGDFTVMLREDGKPQWAYKGERLYTFNDDYSPGDINGLVAQKDAQIALAYKNYIPPALNIDIPAFRGPIMVSAKGMTVYTQSPYKVQYGGRETRDGFRVPYDTGKKVGGKGCTADCLNTWKPVTAPANAQSSGFWEVVARPDGSKQWAYKGSALYTFTGDKQPGDDRGNNRHDVLFGDAEGKADLSLTGGDQKGATGSGFYWHLVTFIN